MNQEDAVGGSAAEMMALVEELYPIPRSITGDGVRESLGRIRRIAPVEIKEVPSGTPVFDWRVPEEWNVREAYVKDPAGEKVIDFAESPLHLVGYSEPVEKTLPLSDLKAHLHSIPDRPDWIPYKTSYYHRTWGFCLRHSVLSGLPEGDYEVRIDASLAPGALTYGELLVEGASEEEVLISTHICHPAMCNDNLSGMVVAAFLARRLLEEPGALSYRFLFVPGTIGAIAWLAQNEGNLSRIKHGLVLSGVGDRGGLTYKKSRSGEAFVDRAATHVLRHSGEGNRVREFEPLGYDERQYCSPGIDLPVGCLMRTPWGEYPEYHTSADDLSFVTGDSLSGTFEACLAIFRILEWDRTYHRTDPRGEPQLGRRGVFPATGGHRTTKELERAVLWILNLSDGHHSLLDIAERSGLAFSAILEGALSLEEKGLLFLPKTPDLQGNADTD